MSAREELAARDALFFGDILADLRERLVVVSVESGATLAAACSSHLLERHGMLPLTGQHPSVVRAGVVNTDLWRALEAPTDIEPRHRVVEGHAALQEDPHIDIDAVAAAFFAADCYCNRDPGSAYWSASRIVDAAFARAAVPSAERPPYSFVRSGLSPAQLASLRVDELAENVSVGRFIEDAAGVEVQDALLLLQRALGALDERSELPRRLRALFSVAVVG